MIPRKDRKIVRKERLDAILSGIHYEDGVAIRNCAVENGVTTFTSLDTVKVLLDVLEEITMGISTIDS